MMQSLGMPIKPCETEKGMTLRNESRELGISILYIANTFTQFWEGFKFQNFNRVVSQTAPTTKQSIIC